MQRLPYLWMIHTDGNTHLQVIGKGNSSKDRSNCCDRGMNRSLYYCFFWSRQIFYKLVIFWFLVFGKIERLLWDICIFINKGWKRIWKGWEEQKKLFFCFSGLAQKIGGKELHRNGRDWNVKKGWGDENRAIWY